MTKPLPGIFTRQSRAFERARVLIPVIYAFAAFLAIQELPRWQSLLDRADFSPLWPLAWAGSSPDPSLLLGLLTLQLLALVWAAIHPSSRSARVAAFIGAFLFLALRNSFGKIGHSGHLLVLLLFVLIFLPQGWSLVEKKTSRLLRQKTLLVLWSGMALMMLTYTMSGLGKVVVGIWQTFQGQISVVHPEALALHIATRLMSTYSESSLGSFLIDHVWTGWPMMIGAVYFQFFALWTMFRPALQPLFAVGLILFHLASYFTMTIIFHQNCFLLMILFIVGPFVPAAPAIWRKMAADLPILGYWVGRIFDRFFPAPR